MTEQPLDVLDGFRQDAGITHGELWLRYLELGVMSTGFERKTFLYGLVKPTTDNLDVIACALTERFAELGGDHPAAYLEDVGNQ